VPGELVVFDFDGTLTRSDTLIPFLATVDPARTARHAPPAVAAALRRPDQRDQLKERLIGRVLGRRSEDEVRRAGQRFGRRVLPRLLRPDVVAHLEAHRAAGRRLALASASPGAVVTPAAHHLAIDLVVCTGLAPPGDGSPVWRYRDGNCRGPVKLARVEALIERVGPDRLWVYGNLPDDAPILGRADVAVAVDRRRLDPLR
jgi:phosphatidylglycerophosphatase C